MRKGAVLVVLLTIAICSAACEGGVVLAMADKEAFYEYVLAQFRRDVAR